jgi:hypothetical protein
LVQGNFSSVIKLEDALNGRSVKWGERYEVILARCGPKIFARCGPHQSGRFVCKYSESVSKKGYTIQNQLHSELANTP